MLRQLAVTFMALTLCWTTLACGDPLSSSQADGEALKPASPVSSPSSRLSDGQYPVQQATYNDGSGEYNLMLLNTPPGAPPVFQTTNLPMARLTDAEIQAGKKSYLKVENNQPALYLTEDFKIEYVHNVTEAQTNPGTGQQETVVVRQETSFWTPFAAALAAQAAANILFRPHYYMPPIYQPGVILVGNGGYGRTYSQAVDRYQSRYRSAPAEVRNRQAFRTTGRYKTSTSPSNTGQLRPGQGTRDRSTGYGYGTNTLRRSNRSYPTRTNRGSGSFGSGRGLSRSRRR